MDDIKDTPPADPDNPATPQLTHPVGTTAAEDVALLAKGREAIERSKA